MGKRRVRLVQADEAEIFPVVLGELAVGRRQPDLLEISAERGRRVFEGAEGARLDQPDEMAGWIEPADLIEHIVPELAIFQGDAPALENAELVQNVGLDEGERGQS